MELIDFHSHILAHMDHGARRTATSLAQLDTIYKAGVGAVCASSHFYPQQVLPETFLRARAQWLDHVIRHMEDNPRPAIIPSAEVLICEGMEELEGLSDLCVEGTNVLLLEMPFTQEHWNNRLYNTVAEIGALGINPVLAHVDRYPKKLIEPLFEMGFTGQLNASSLVGFFKPRHLLRWIDEGHIVALGSDLHGSDPKGYEPFTKVVAAMPDRVERIMTATAELLRDAVRY